MKLIIFASLLGLLSINSYASQPKEQAEEAFLAVKLHADLSSFDGLQINKGGAYDVRHSKLEVGNFLVNLAYEKFAVNWDDQQSLPFATGAARPISEVQRYALKTHIPYRLNNKQMWLWHLGAEWAFEDEIQESLSVQSYLLYSEKFNLKRSWQLGLYINYHQVETVVLPIVQYTYNYPFVDRQGFYGHVGFPRTQIGYHLSPRLRTDFGLVYHQSTVKLAEDSVIQPSGFFQSKNWRASWQAHYRFNKQWQARLGVQASVSNKLILFNRDYKEQDYFYGNEGVGWNLGISYQF